MDISDISKVASRKRMNTDVEKLREKVSRETAKVIKLKVAQDTAYWDLKEKLQQLESNHERLQQNMVEVQMQHEAISGQYQEELRLRPDTLNKLGGTREICDVLEEYGERLRRTVARASADQRALAHAYGACGASVRRLAADAARAAALSSARHDDVRRARERHEADAQHLSASAEQLGAARARCDMLEEVRRDMADKMERYRLELQRHEEDAVSTRAEMARLQRELDDKMANIKQTIAAYDSELDKRRASTEREASARREAEARAQRLQRLLDEAHERMGALGAEYQETNAIVERLNKEIESLVEDKKEMERELTERRQRVLDIEAELADAREHITALESDKLQRCEELTQALQQCDAEAKRAGELAQRATELEAQASKALEENAYQQAEAVRLIQELRITITEREHDLTSKTDTITRLMSDLKSEAEARNRSEAALTTTRQQYDAERTAGDAARTDLNATIQRLEITIRNKDEEITSQKTVIQEIRNEKDRLQERIRAMQSTINNIQQELNGRVPPPAPTAERERDAMMYSYLSDGSVDSDALDTVEVNRRFEALARGERPLPPLRVPRTHGNRKLSQAKKESKLQGRRFFKSKLENKMTKINE